MLKLAIILAVLTASSVRADKFFLTTRNNVHDPEMISPSGHLPMNSFFNPEDRTIFLIHGDGGSALSRFNTLVKEVILGLRVPTNIIVYDWAHNAQFGYSVSSARVPESARVLENFIRGLVEETGVDYTKLHLVGFGLGSHIAGMAARWYRRFSGSITNFGIGRITGLDPSGLGWDAMSLGLRSDDALYVEVIYTDDPGPQGNGAGAPIGRVTFYANGGRNQPGCLTSSCSHDRAFALFAASMINPNLVGYPCMTMAEVELNLCKGSPLPMGGTEIDKYDYQPLWWVYRVNTGSVYPY